jgi:UPF0716 protein FxsA
MWVFLAILSVPLVEIGLFVQLGGAIGLWPTLAWVIVSAALGIMVLKKVSMRGSISLSRDMREMSDPLSPLAHQAMVVMAAGLLILPGFLTDAIGLLLLIRPVRTLLITLVGRRLRKAGTVNAQTTVIEGEWEEVDPETRPKGNNPPSDWTRH